MSTSLEPSGCEHRQAGQFGPKGHLPRLAPEYYRGPAFVHWTLTIENRATGWLSTAFDHAWRLVMLHACARHCLVCPAYVLMPDHMHLLWLGSCSESDQRKAIEFLRHHLRPALFPTDWQRQAHDHVFREGGRKRDAFVAVAKYVLANPVRAGLAGHPSEYPYLGSCIPGYPDLEIRTEDYWERFWRIYDYLLTK